jgi:hypothetical protein
MSLGHREMRRPVRGDAPVQNNLWNVGAMVATNTVLFTSLDLGQWIGETLSLGMLPANLVAAVIATAFGLAMNAASQMFGANSAD